MAIHDTIKLIHQCLAQKDKTCAQIYDELNGVYLPAFNLVFQAEQQANALLEPAKKTVEITANINALVDGETVLTRACRKGLAQCIPLLLQAGADVNLANEQKNLPIGIAAAAGHTNCVTKLFAFEDAGHGDFYAPKLNHVAFHSPKGFEFYASQLAARGGHYDMLQTLQGHGANPMLIASNKKTLLHYAACNDKNKSSQCINLLLDQDVPIDAVDKFDNTALHLAAGAGAADCIAVLTARNAKTTGKNQDNITPIFLTCKKGDPKSLQHLLAATPPAERASASSERVNVPFTNRAGITSPRDEYPLRAARNSIKASKNREDAANCIFMLLMAGASVDVFEKEHIVEDGFQKELRVRVLKKAKTLSTKDAIIFLKGAIDPENNLGSIMWEKPKTMGDRMASAFVGFFRSDSNKALPEPAPARVKTEAVALIEAAIATYAAQLAELRVGADQAPFVAPQEPVAEEVMKPQSAPAPQPSVVAQPADPANDPWGQHYNANDGWASPPVNPYPRPAIFQQQDAGAPPQPYVPDQQQQQQEYDGPAIPEF